MAKNLIKKLQQYVKLFPIKNYTLIEGWLSPKEALGIYNTAALLQKNSVIVEIGSWQGKSTYCLARGLKSGKIYAIDPFNAESGADDELNTKTYQEIKGDKNLLETFWSNMKKTGASDKIIVKKGYSTDFPNDFDKIDFLFIDGDHSVEGCKTDFELYSNKIVKGGFIAFHDYYKDRAELGPTYVVHNLVKKDQFRFHALYDTLWVGVRI
jgi:predicted O-methyltransferase YrrM